jgi:mRNA-degrading endonuclease YafQ of YafQ-DinJ toxin-antitoxin module
MTRELVESPRFKRARCKFAGRDRRRQDCISEILILMGTNVFAPKLKSHSLTGRLEGFYACSCGYGMPDPFHH